MQETEKVRDLAYEYAEEIAKMLDRVPRQMLLLFKLNDCMRHANIELGAQVNTFAIAARVATRSICAEEEHATKKSLLSRLRARLVTWWTLLVLELRLFVFRTLQALQLKHAQRLHAS